MRVLLEHTKIGDYEMLNTLGDSDSPSSYRRVPR